MILIQLCQVFYDSLAKHGVLWYNLYYITLFEIYLNLWYK